MHFTFFKQKFPNLRKPFDFESNIWNWEGGGERMFLASWANFNSTLSGSLRISTCNSPCNISPQKTFFRGSASPEGLIFAICKSGPRVPWLRFFGLHLLVVCEGDLLGEEEVSEEACLHHAFVSLCRSESLCKTMLRRTA